MDLNLLKSAGAKAKKVNEILVTKLFEEEILRHKDEIVQFVKERWKRGVRPTGDIIGIYSWFEYQQEKARMNPLAGGNVDLIYTGALRDGLTVNPLAGGAFSIFSDDEKAVDIAQKYGLDVYGLTNEEILVVKQLTAARVNMRLFNHILNQQGL